MKKTMTSLVLAAVAAVSLFGASNVVRAADTNSLTGSTNASVTFEGGNLSLSDTVDSITFDKQNAGTVFASGISDVPANKAMTATVDDFLAGAAGWSLKVKQSGWAGADTATVTALTTGATLKLDNAAITTADAEAATGEYGSTPNAFDKKGNVTLSIAQGTVVKPGEYTNTLTWTLTDPILDTAK